MRIVIWHGYLLGGTGSNVYTRSLARTWSRRGHDVVVLCQEPHPERYDLGGARIVRPQLDGPLPVFVLDRYEDAEPILLGEMDVADRDRFVEVNAAAVRAELPADLLLVNHVLLGAPVGAAVGGPFIVKVHGSELEYAMRGDPELARWGAQTLSAATAVIAGSDHIVEVLDEVVGPGSFTSRTGVIPPGVDVETLRPRDRDAALAALIDESRRDPPNHNDDHDERAPDEGNAERFATFFADPAPTVLYVGKLSDEKGVPLLLEAMRTVDARLIVVGFGPARAALEEQADDRVLFTGPLEHRHLMHLWPLADVAVTPSVFPEAFGMVAAEAAACGCPPLVARHSGLAETATRLEASYPAALRHLASFKSGDVADLRRKLTALVCLPGPDRQQLAEAVRVTAVAAWSWEKVADRIVAMMDGQLETPVGEVAPQFRNLVDGRVHLVEYDAAWPHQFEKEATRIRTALGDSVLTLEHVGSTSVPGLAAKPCVDILLVVHDSSDEAAYGPALTAAGYRLVIREPDWHQHRVYKGPEFNLNLHVFSEGSSEVERLLLFRDHLRADPRARDRYLAAKRELAERTWDTIQDYADAKSAVIEEVIEQARS